MHPLKLSNCIAASIPGSVSACSKMEAPKKVEEGGCREERKFRMHFNNLI